MSPQFRRRAAAALAPLAVAAFALPSSASAATAAASETITGGGLTFINSTPAAVTFPTTSLNGSDQTIQTTQALDISDARGTGAGWNVTATSTYFNNGSVNLPASSATTITSLPPATCDASVTCVTPTNSVSYPFTLPAGATAPLAQKMYNAAANTGTGAMTVTPTWKLLVPATSQTGTYNSTWTLSLVSGP